MISFQVWIISFRRLLKSFVQVQYHCYFVNLIKLFFIQALQFLFWCLPELGREPGIFGCFNQFHLNLSMSFSSCPAFNPALLLAGVEFIKFENFFMSWLRIVISFQVWIISFRRLLKSFVQDQYHSYFVNLIKMFLPGLYSFFFNAGQGLGGNLVFLVVLIYFISIYRCATAATEVCCWLVQD